MNKKYIRMFFVTLLLQSTYGTIIQANDGAWFIAAGSICTTLGAIICCYDINKTKPQIALVESGESSNSTSINTTKKHSSSCNFSDNQFIRGFATIFIMMGIGAIGAGSFYLNN